jgi:hypothetical protein
MVGQLAANQVRLQLFVLAYNLGNFLRQSVLPQSVRHWTLTTLREKLIKIGANVVRHFYFKEDLKWECELPVNMRFVLTE